MGAKMVCMSPEAEVVVEDFSLERLERLLSDKKSVLRHDVDYDPACAYEMAQMEKELNVFSTFYIRPLDDYASASNAQYFFEGIQEAGMELAPHVDLFLPRGSKVDSMYMSVCSEQDFERLKETLPVVRKVSFHAPPRDIYWRPVEGFYHALDKEWFGCYVSDSRGRFRFSPERALTEGNSLIQIGLHPEWWFWPEAKRSEWQVREAAKP